MLAGAIVVLVQLSIAVALAVLSVGAPAAAASAHQRRWNQGRNLQPIRRTSVKRPLKCLESLAASQVCYTASSPAIQQLASIYVIRQLQIKTKPQILKTYKEYNHNKILFRITNILSDNIRRYSIIKTFLCCSMK